MSIWGMARGLGPLQLASGLAIVLLAGVSACGAEESGSPPSARPSPSAEASSDESDDTEDARIILRKALRQWQAADTGAFTQSLSFGPVGGQKTTGVYQLSSRTSSSTQVTDAPDGQRFEFQFEAIRDVTYMNAKDWPATIRNCWLRLDGAAVEQATGMAQAPGAGGLPANLIALSYARGTKLDPTDPDSVTGTVDLPTAAMMFGSGALKMFDDPAMNASVEAEFTLDEGNIDSWRVGGDDLVAAMDREGLLSGVSDDLREGLEAFEVEVEYQQLGSTQVDVRPPARSLQMTPEHMDAQEGCPAAR